MGLNKKLCSEPCRDFNGGYTLYLDTYRFHMPLPRLLYGHSCQFPMVYVYNIESQIRFHGIRRYLAKSCQFQHHRKPLVGVEHHALITKQKLYIMLSSVSTCSCTYNLTTRLYALRGYTTTSVIFNLSCPPPV